MNRIVCRLVGGLAAVSMVLVSSSAAQAAVLSLPDNAQGGPNAFVQVPISVDPGTGILGVDMRVTYDPAVILAQNVTATGIGAAAGFVVVANLNTPGVIIISTFAPGPPLSGSGEFLSIRFLVVGIPGNTSNLTITNASINEGGIPATIDNGLFTVTCAGASEGSPCSDGDNACTPVDTCQGGVCVGTPLSCDDSNPCTADSCAPGVGCENTPGNAGAVCRASAGECDVVENCTGASAACPADGSMSSGTPCTDDGNACTTDQCSGSSASCQHPAGNPGAECRASAGICDVAETCSGASTTCPEDGFVSGTECRASAGECDVAENCTGASAACPADVLQASGTSCTNDGNPCTADQCNGASTSCQHMAGNAGALCRASAGVCDEAETCSGSSTTCPADGFVLSGTVCQAATGACDLPESCTGASAECPADGANLTSECRVSAGVCDLPESCSDASDDCPADGFIPAGTECREAGGQCDVAESCTGVSSLCPEDLPKPNGTSCDDNDSTTCTDICTAGSCAGTSVAEPLAIDDSLRIAKDVGGNAEVSWVDAPGPYNVYRGSNVSEAPWQYDQTCLVHETTATVINDPAIPPVNTLFFYLVSRVNACRESILGTDSAGAIIPNSTPCSNARTETDGGEVATK